MMSLKKRHKVCTTVTQAGKRKNNTFWHLRDVPDRAQIQERRLKSQQKTEERKKKKELIEKKIEQEEQARLDRQRKREERR